MRKERDQIRRASVKEWVNSTSRISSWLILHRSNDKDRTTTLLILILISSMISGTPYGIYYFNSYNHNNCQLLFTCSKDYFHRTCEVELLRKSVTTSVYLSIDFLFSKYRSFIHNYYFRLQFVHLPFHVEEVSRGTANGLLFFLIWADLGG